jgi:hypothetical protein
MEDRKNWLLKIVGESFSEYAYKHPAATVGTLKEFVEAALSQCQDFDEDDLIDEDIVPEELGEYLHMWATDPEDADPFAEPLTYGYRLGNLWEDQGHVEELAELVGDDFPLSELSKVKNSPPITVEEFSERLRLGLPV